VFRITFHVDPELARTSRRAGRVLRRPAAIAAVALLAIGVPLGIHAAQVDVPNSFSSGTTASASAVNANFDALAAGINDNDSRLTVIEANNAVPSAEGVNAYATTSDDEATLESTFNSSGGGVEAAGASGSYSVTFEDVSCEEGDTPVGVAMTVPYPGNTAVSCRVGGISQNAEDCTISVRCFDSNGNNRGGPFGLLFIK
jgi:hypothetical protein